MKQENPAVEAWVLERLEASLRRRFPNPESRTLPFEKAAGKPVRQDESSKNSQGGHSDSRPAPVNG